MPEDQGKYHDVMLYDYHGDRTGLLYDSKWRPGYARCFVIVNFFNLADWKVLYSFEGLPDHVERAIGEWNSGASETGGCIIGVYGYINDHRQLFKQLHADLMEGPQGGDDDYFDYWPGACETLEMYASELVKIDPQGRKAYAKAIGDLNSKWLGEVDEWEGIELRYPDGTVLG